jgi:hypothetical protein
MSIRHFPDSFAQLIQAAGTGLIRAIPQHGHRRRIHYIFARTQAGFDLILLAGAGSVTAEALGDILGAPPEPGLVDRLYARK